jgi:hypothetical protein
MSALQLIDLYWLLMDLRPLATLHPAQKPLAQQPDVFEGLPLLLVLRRGGECPRRLLNLPLGAV